MANSTYIDQIVPMDCLRNRLVWTCVPFTLALLPNIMGMDGWMTLHFTSFSTVFQSYKDDERLIMKGCLQWSLLRLRRFSLEWGSNLGLLDQ